MRAVIAQTKRNIQSSREMITGEITFQLLIVETVALLYH